MLTTLWRVVLLVLAVLRATRLVTQDWLGFWWLVQPARKWAAHYEMAEFHRLVREERGRGARQRGTHTWMLQDGRTVDDPTEFVMESWDEDEAHTWQAKLVKGLDCPFCVGFHLGWLAILGEVTLGRLPGVKHVWRFGVAAFALNYLVGHVSSRIDR